MARRNAAKRAPQPPEWEIDARVMSGMSGGYRRIRDGVRLQKESRRGVWVLWVDGQPVAEVESPNPPLVWADRQIPARRTG
ncbi:MAG: hypothetical protein CMH57_05670 [Myxococcales bacterium]|nr:hypothetical protein [Myxococcales bacterium]